MQTGFDVTAAVPKRLRAADDAPVAQTMRGERKITQAPSTDQKKVRRQMQRKTASIEVIASMELSEYLQFLGGREELSDIEVEAGIRDWWRARQTAFDPLKGSGIPGTTPQVACGNCGGHGVEPMNPMSHCGRCGGTGSEAVAQATPSDSSHTTGCRSCSGTGQGFQGEACPRCAGTGSERANSRNPNFAIPADKPGAPTAQPARTVLPPSSFGRSAALNDVGDCRLCEGPLVPKSRDGGTVKAECGDCGTEHSLQASTVEKASARIEMFSNLTDFERERLAVIAVWTEPDVECPKCGAKDQKAVGWAGGSKGNRMQLVCPGCGHKYDEAVGSNWERQKKNPGSHGRGASSHFATLLSLVGSTWEPVLDVSPYLGHSGMTAIARRAQSVLDTEENS